MFRKNNLYLLYIYILICIVGFLLIYDFNLNKNVYKSDINNFGNDTYDRFIYIGSSDCNASNNTDIIKFIKEIKNKFKKVVHNNDLKIIYTGIAQDLNAKKGIEFLSQTGPYDEIYSGASWFNLGIMKYIWKEDFQGPASTP